VILGWVRIVRYSHGVNLLCRLAGLREVPAPRGRFFGRNPLHPELYHLQYPMYSTDKQITEMR
jgi:hypothetical protein